MSLIKKHEILMGEIIFIGNARDYHAMDWYRTTKEVSGSRDIMFATDLIDSESHLKIVSEADNIIDLYNIDWLLFKRQTSTGQVWRNLVKLLVSPLQVLKIRSIKRKYPNAIFHAHTMYYMFLSWLARIKFIGTPQGSEVLVRPDRSAIYMYFSCKSLTAANHIIVDSVKLKQKINELCGKEAVVIQNGIDVSTILSRTNNKLERPVVLSFRGMYPLYRIHEILAGRANSKRKPPISFIYPFWEDTYKRMVLSKLEPNDADVGRLQLKNEMYDLFSSTFLAISIPQSDSSPRSVYEAIFCGCCVAVTYNSWIESLPQCMRSRLFIVDLKDEGWFDEAIKFALSITKDPFVPSENALDLFDQDRTMKKVVCLFYGSSGGRVRKPRA